MNLSKEVRAESEGITAQLEARLTYVFEEIGRHFYEENKDTILTDSVYNELIDQVKMIEKERDLQELRVLVKQGMRKCHHCHKIITIDSIYCNQCGTKLEPLPEELNEEWEAEEEPIKTCMECGTELEPDAVFCPNCGKKQI